MRHHLAILYPTYLHLIREGYKTIECRLSRVRRPPYGRIETGDLIWLKESCGPVRLVAQAGQVRTLTDLNRVKIHRLRESHNHAICAEPGFWRARSRSTFGTLIWLRSVQSIEPFRVRKTDRRSWVVLDGPLAPNQCIAHPPRSAADTSTVR